MVQITSWEGSELSKSIENLRKLESYGGNETTKDGLGDRALVKPL